MKKLLAMAFVIAPLAFSGTAAAQLGDILGRELEKRIPGGGDLGRQVLEEVVSVPVMSAKNDRQVVAAYSRDDRYSKYVMQGALSGVIIGVGANCIKNVTGDNSCLDGAGVAAAVGGGLGAAGGWIVASRQNEYENKSEAYEKQLNSARLELEQARTNREAAQRIVAKHSEKLSELREKSETSSSAKRKLEKQLKRAQEDLDMMQSAANRLEMEISALQSNIKETKDSAARRDFAALETELVAERDGLQAEIDSLNGLVATS